MNTFIGTNPTNGNTPNAYNLTAAFNPYNSDKFGANSSTMNSVFQHNTITSGAVGEYVNDNTTSASIRCNTHNQDNITKEGLYVQVDALKTPFFGACPASQTRVDYHNRFITATNSPANHLYKLAGPSKDYLVKKDEAFRPLNAFSYGYNVEDDCNEGSIQLIYCDYKNLPNNGGIVIGLPADKAKYAAIKVQLPNPPTGLPDFGHPTLGGLYSDLAEVKHDILFGYMNSFGQEDDAGIIDEYLTFLHHDGSKEFKRMHIAALYDLDSLEQMQHMLDEYEITDSDDEAFFSYFSMLLIVQSENRSIFDLTESEHNMLIEMATTEYAVAESAKGILELVYHQNFTREVEYIPTENNNGYSANNNQSPHVLELSPNPVMQNGMLNVSYTINQVEVNGVLLPNAVGAKVALVNGFGVQADEQILNNASGTIIFNTAGYVPGIYYVRLIDGQGNTLNHKLACIGL